MGRFRARDVATALTSKGFAAFNNDHTYFHFRYAGKDVGVFTMISHNEREIGAPLARKMRQQMKLESNTDFQRFVDCPLTQTEYEAILRKQGIIS